MELLLPRVIVPVPKPPSYVALDMAFGVGAGSSLFDKSRYRSHGTISGAAWATGLHGKCLDFDPATPSYVEIPAAHTQLNFTTEDFSLIARVNIDDLTDWRFLFARGLINVDGYYIGIGTNGQIQVLTAQSSAYQNTDSANGSIVAGSRYTVGFSRNGASVLTYANGVDVTGSPGTHKNPASSSRSAKIGIRDNLTDYPHDGKIEFLRIFGGIALSASEHKAWHNALA